MKESRHITNRKIVLIFFLVDLFFLVVFGTLKLFEYDNSWITFLKISIQFIIIMGVSRVFTFIIINKLFDWGYVRFNFVILGKSKAISSFLKDFNELRDVITFSKRYNLTLNIPGQLTDILKGQVTIDEIEKPPFVVIHSKGIPFIQVLVKRLLDIVISIIGLILLLPVLPFIIYSIKRSSPGAVFFTQERIGRNGVPFRMFKFRTMYEDAENGTPALSSSNDPRITIAGKWLRQWRLDELPQLVNVLIGHMSLVGPRPERQYFLEKILEKAPYYSLVLKVKPGITSLGMVKFGYAENLEQMILRLRYDVLYVENQTLLLDLKILFYTIGTLLNGEGK